MRSSRALRALARALLWLAILLPAPLRAADGPGGALRVEPVATAPVRAEPGRVVTGVFYVVNTSSETHRLVEHIDVPPNWQVVVPPAHFALGSGQRESRLVAFRVPASAAAGRYRVFFTIGSPNDPELTYESVLEVTVLPVYRLRMSVAAVPLYVRAGTSFETTCLVTNEGNVEVDVRLRLTSSTGYVVRADAASLRLAPRETRRVLVTVVTPPEIAQAIRHTLRVEAVVAGVPSAAVQVTSGVEVVPGTIRTPRPEPVVRGRVGVAALHGRRGQGGLLELQGSGKLPNGRFDVDLRAAGGETGSIYHRRSRYAVSYSGQRATLSLGDHTYALTPLTEMGQPGFGAGGSIRSGRVTVGGFAHRNRFAFMPESQRAAFVAYQAAEPLAVQASYLGRTGDFGGDLVTLRTLLSTPWGSAFDGECGMDAGQSSACAVGVSGERPRFSYRARYLRAGATYPGYLRNLDAREAGVSLRPWSWFRVDGTWTRHEQGAGSDAAPGVPRRSDHSLRLGAGVLGVVSGWSGYAFGYVSDQGRGLNEGARWLERRERAMQWRGGLSNGRISLRGTLTTGRVHGGLPGPAEPFRRYEAQLGITTRRGHSVDATVDYLTGTTLSSPLPQELLMGGLNARFQFTRRTRLLLNARGAVQNARNRHVHLLAQGALEHTFASGGRIEVAAQQVWYAGARGTSATDVKLAYSLPLELRAPRRSPRQSVTGRVYDAETGNGLEGVVLRLDRHRVITGPDGTFRIPAPPPGTYSLQVDRVSIGFDHTTSIQMPMQITVSPEALPALEIGVARRAQVTGRFQLAADGDTSAFGGNGRVLLQLSSPAGQYRVFADVREGFSFPDLYPGRWTLQVLSASLPEFHYVAEASRTVDLAAGDEKEITLFVRKKERAIKMLSGAAVQLTAPPAVVEQRTPAATAVHRKRHESRRPTATHRTDGRSEAGTSDRPRIVPPASVPDARPKSSRRQPTGGSGARAPLPATCAPPAWSRPAGNHQRIRYADDRPAASASRALLQATREWTVDGLWFRRFTLCTLFGTVRPEQAVGGPVAGRSMPRDESEPASAGFAGIARTFIRLASGLVPLLVLGLWQRIRAAVGDLRLFRSGRARPG